MGEIDELRWANRPLRHMTMGELERALEERKDAIISAASGAACEQIQLAIERLTVEIDGRRARASA